ncbi:MAG: hypothetical protein WDM76_01510 [Limisphaerales bacterium]
MSDDANLHRIYDDQTITVVSGLPRSGTSLMMQMLAAGGMPLLTDAIRKPDEDNPRGYFEFERVKQIKHDKAWLGEAVGKAVKIIHLLLYELPSERNYRGDFHAAQHQRSVGFTTKNVAQVGTAARCIKQRCPHENLRITARAGNAMARQTTQFSDDRNLAS